MHAERLTDVTVNPDKHHHRQASSTPTSSSPPTHITAAPSPNRPPHCPTVESPHDHPPSGMEPIGLAVGIVGLAALFSSCLEAIDRVKTYRSFDTDSQTLNAQFDADCLLLERWGRNVGIEKGKLLTDHHELLDDKKIASVAMQLLSSINLVCNLNGPTVREGAVKSRLPKDSIHSPHGLRDVVGASRTRKLAWSIGGKDEKKSLVELFGESVQKLHHLVPPDRVVETHHTPGADGELVYLSQGSNPSNRPPQAGIPHDSAESQQFLGAVPHGQHA